MTSGQDTSRAVSRVAMVEYTDLRKTITFRDVETMCLEAAVLGFAAVVVPSALVRRASACLDGEGSVVGTAISYPFGSQSPGVKAREAEIAVEHGAAELDVVPHFGAVLAERWSDLAQELGEIRRASGTATLKLALEFDRLGAERIRETCKVALGEGFEFVVNTLGFRMVSTVPEAQGAATATVLAALRELAGGLKVKASGGVTTGKLLDELIEAGADRVAVTVGQGVLRAMGLQPTKGRTR